MEAISPITGEITPLSQAAMEIPRPAYWRRTEGIIQGDPGPEYERAFLAAQKAIGPVVETDAENAFNKSRYTSLPHLLAKVVPAANKEGLTLKQGTGRIMPVANESGARQLLLLPIWTLVRHAETGQWERVIVEIPLIKIDPQGLASAFSYGRRYALQAFWAVAGTDDDGVLGSLKPRLDNDPVDEAIAGLAEHIADCKTAEQLLAWRERNRQGFALLSDASVAQLRQIYTRRMDELKAAAPATEKPKKARDAGN